MVLIIKATLLGSIGWDGLDSFLVPESSRFPPASSRADSRNIPLHFSIVSRYSTSENQQRTNFAFENQQTSISKTFENQRSNIERTTSFFENK